MQRRVYLRLDPDDILLPNSVELLLTELVKNDQNGFVFGNYDVIDRFGNKWYSYEYSAGASLRLDPPLGACTMFRRSVLKKVGGYFEEFDCQDGHDIWLKCRETVKHAIVKKTIFQYRRHKNNLTNSACRLLDTRYKIYERHNAGRDKKNQNYYVVIPIHDESDRSFIDPFLFSVSEI